MTRGTKSALITVAVVLLLLVAGYMAFIARDDRRAAAFSFAVKDPEAALRQIAQIAERSGTLDGSGVGVAIPGRESAILGRTQWTISPDGAIRGAASERGLVVALMPEMRDGKVVWNCKLEPEREFMRGACAFLLQVNR